MKSFVKLCQFDLPWQIPRLHGSSIVAVTPVQLVSLALRLQGHNSPPEGTGLSQCFIFRLNPGPQSTLHVEKSSSSLHPPLAKTQSLTYLFELLF